MNKLYFTIFAFVFLAGLLVLPQIVRAQDFSIQFNPDPLFSAENFLPGDTIEGEVIIQNQTNQSQTLYLWTQNEVDPSNFGRVLLLTVQKGQDQIYQIPLSELFSQDFVELLQVPQGETILDFSLHFLESAGNEYQNKSLQFDLVLGINTPSEEEEEGEGSGSSAILIGGGVILPQLEIYNLKVKEIGTDWAKITWNTTLPATTQIIFSEEGKPHQFEPQNPPLYGYFQAFPEPEDSNYKTFHQVVLEELKVCKTYYFRAISHNTSKTAISQEKSFKTLCPEEEAKESGQKPQEENQLPPKESKETKKEFPETSTETESKPTEKQQIEGETQPVISEEPSSEPSSLEWKEEIEKEIQEKLPPKTPFENLLATVGGFFNKIFSKCLPLWLILLLVAYSLFETGKSAYFWKKKKKKVNQNKKHTFIFSVWAILLLIFWYFSKDLCLNFWILLGLLFITLILKTFFLEEEKASEPTPS